MTEEPQPQRAAGADVGAAFDVVIVEVAERDGGWALDVVITAGPRKGDVLELAVAVNVDSSTAGGDRPVDPLQLLGLPATVVITDDGPRLRL